MTLYRAATPSALDEAAAVLRRGGLVAFPTETVYGLGANACDDAAVARLYDAKGRPAFNPLIAHVADRDAAEAQGRFSADAGRLAGAFWPGPLTLVVPAVAGCRISALARAGLDSVALRVPAHPVARALIAASGLPIAAPSANRSGRISPTTAAHVRSELDGRLDMVLEDGPCAVGLESTIVSCLGDLTILRPGGVSAEALAAALGRPLADAPSDIGGHPVAPGLLASHYAPEARLRLEASTALEGEAILDFGGRLAGCRHKAAYRDLSPGGDLAEAAAHLFAALRELDTMGATMIAVAPIPATGLGVALNDRLARAAAPRPRAISGLPDVAPA